MICESILNRLGAELSSWRDSQTGAEVDVVLELPNGRWAGFEIKLGESAADTAAASLQHFASKIDTSQHGKPLALAVITGGQFTYRRRDGVDVIPITALAPYRRRRCSAGLTYLARRLAEWVE